MNFLAEATSGVLAIMVVGVLVGCWDWCGTMVDAIGGCPVSGPVPGSYPALTV